MHHQRKLAKPSQSQLAELLETNKQTLSMVENGKRRATIKKLVKLRNIFGVTANELLPKD
ncbi:TPA: helix-turn-helix transcriptional regulator [Streptococcus equi subsp. zooepidemicus]|nr:helix-turn-helix transcriptional regulator [Streptococcus equi subsp. zooepidemicus]